MGDKAAKAKLFDGFGAVAKALASGRRMEILDVLAQGPRSVEELASEIDQSVANTSHHLRTMARAGLLLSDREGTRIVYRVASPKVTELWRALRDVASEQVAEIDRLARAYVGERDGLEPVPREELARRLRRKDVVVLDVRPATEYRAGHIAGARSIPMKELSRRLRAVPKDTDVVAYCRGPYCVFADDAVRTLTRRGISGVPAGGRFPGMAGRRFARRGRDWIVDATEGETVAGIAVDVAKLRDEIRTKYVEVVEHPDATFHFHTGLRAAANAGYRDEWLEGLPKSSIASFAGVANPFHWGLPRPGERVVDVGSGTGMDAMVAANAVGAEGRVVGVDMTPEMLERARAGAEEAGIRNVEFREGLAEQLPVDDGWADLVISNGVINLVPDKLGAYREIARVLKPGGRAQIADICVEKPVPESALSDIDLWTG